MLKRKLSRRRTVRGVVEEGRGTEEQGREIEAPGRGTEEQGMSKEPPAMQKEPPDVPTTAAVDGQNREKKRRKKKKGTEIDARSILPIEYSRYFIERDGEAFRKLFAATLKLGNLMFDDEEESMTVIQDDADPGCVVRLVTKPDLASWVPAKVRHAVASAAEIEFHDDIEYRYSDIREPPFRLRVSTRSPFLGKKFSLHSTLTITPVDAWSCEQRLHGYVEVHMLGFGGFIERMVKDSVEGTYRKLPGVISLWNTKRKEMIANGDFSELVRGRPSKIDCGIEWIRLDDYSQQGDGSRQREILDGPALPLEKKEVPKEEVEPSTTSSALEADKPSMMTVPEKEVLWPPGVGAKLAYGLKHFWNEFLDVLRVLFIMILFLLLRTGLVRVEKKQRPASRPRHQRSASWDAFARGQLAHRHTSSDLSLPEAASLVRHAHVRRASASSQDNQFDFPICEEPQ